MARMILYRVIANDHQRLWQAQYAITAEQMEIRKEDWFQQYVVQHLVKQINQKIGEPEPDFGPIEWRGQTEVWEYVGDDWEVEDANDS